MQPVSADSGYFPCALDWLDLLSYLYFNATSATDPSLRLHRRWRRASLIARRCRRRWTTTLTSTTLWLAADWRQPARMD